MKKSRKHRESSDFSDEDRHTHKYCKQAGYHHDKHLTDDMAAHHRLAADDRHDQRKHGNHPRRRQDHIEQGGKEPIDRSSPQDRPAPKYSKSSDRGHHKHSIGDMARHERTLDEQRQPTTSRGHDANSDSSDEILIKHRASRRLPRSSGGDDIARQIKNIEKAQREALRPSSTESHEIHVHYVPIVTRSASPPQMDHDSHLAPSSAATGSENGGLPVRKSLAQGLSASDVKGQLKDMTMSWFTKRSARQEFHVRRSPPSPRRSKHERHDKHGKKKVLPLTSTSKYLAPLAQRWVCYKCGKVRSDSIQDRHPLRNGKKMQPNWCGKCRVNGELKGRPLSWNGQRHYCWGCGIVRSEKYHWENPMMDGEKSTPNYCKRCRELSPSFERNLRETSEIGSEIDLRDQAFRRQMYDADMSDIDEDGNHGTTSAPGKENEDPNKPKKLMATQSFILKHGASATKTSSDSSFSSTSECGGVPIDMLKAMRLDADRARGLTSPKNGGFRLSGEYYKPPSVESPPEADDIDVEMEDAGAHITYGGGNPSAQEFNLHHGRQPPTVDKGYQTRLDSPAVASTSTRHRVSATEPVATITSNKKKVRWIENSSSRPVTADSTTGFATQPYHSDSGFSSSGYRSDVSMRCTSSARGRLHRLPPGEYSTGSPPRRESIATPAKEGDGDDGEGFVSLQCRASEPRQQGPQLNRSSCFAQGLPPSQGTFGGEVGDRVEPREGPPMPAFACGPTLASYSCATNNLPTPPDSHDQPEIMANTHNVTGGRGGNASGVRQWSLSPDQQIPNFSRPYQSPQRETRTKPLYPTAASYVSSPGYGTRPDYIHHHHHQQQPPDYPAFSSATYFSDSTMRRDFSGYTAAPVGKDDPFNQEYRKSSSPPDLGGGLDCYNPYEHESNMLFEEQFQQQGYHCHSGNDFTPFSANHGRSVFDFSYIGREQMDSEPKFVRRNKTDSSNNNATAGPRCPTTTPSEPQQPQQNWYLYDDDGASFEIYGSGGGENNYQWCDDRTTIHGSGSTTGPSLSSHPHPTALGNNQPRNTVTILSIREITSEEELEGTDGVYSPHDEEEDADGDNDKGAGASDLATVTQGDTPSTICQA